MPPKELERALRTREASAQPTLAEPGEASPPYVFVYGTLRRGANNPMARLLSERTILIGIAVANGQLFDLGTYPGMAPSNKSSDRVVGELYLVSDAERLSDTLAILDDYEACSPKHFRPHEYCRQHVEAATSAGIVWAWAYVLARPTDGLRRIESGDYLKR